MSAFRVMRWSALGSLVQRWSVLSWQSESLLSVLNVLFLFEALVLLLVLGYEVKELSR